jgi:hypothetical protein
MGSGVLGGTGGITRRSPTISTCTFGAEAAGHRPGGALGGLLASVSASPRSMISRRFGKKHAAALHRLDPHPMIPIGGWLLGLSPVAAGHGGLRPLFIDVLQRRAGLMGIVILTSMMPTWPPTTPQRAARGRGLRCGQRPGGQVHRRLGARSRGRSPSGFPTHAVPGPLDPASSATWRCLPAVHPDLQRRLGGVLMFYKLDKRRTSTTSSA